MVQSSQPPQRPEAKPSTTNAKPSSSSPAVIAPAPRKIRPNVADSISITFLTGGYKGMGLNMGTSIVEVKHSQSAAWPSQKAYASREGGLFQSISTRKISLQLEFIDEQNDVSKLIENVATLQEIDPDTGKPPLLIYQEGAITISPVVCVDFQFKKEHPFLGAIGFRYGLVDLTLELLGGATSEHKLAKPLISTELTEAKSRLSAAQRERLGTASIAQTAFLKCLGAERSQRIAELIEKNKLDDIETLRSLDSETLVNLAVAGLIPQEQLTKLAPNIQAAIAVEMARKTDGVGNNSNALAGAITGAPAAGLPADLGATVDQKRQDYQAISEAVLKGDLGDSSAVLQQRSSNAELIAIAGCGLSVRSAVVKSGTALTSNLSPEQQAFFSKELGEEGAKDAAKRDALVLARLNESLGKSDDEIKKAFGLGNADQVAALKGGRPYKSKDEFVTRAAGLNSGVAGLSIYNSYLNQLVSSSGGVNVPVPAQ